MVSWLALCCRASVMCVPRVGGQVIKGGSSNLLPRINEVVPGAVQRPNHFHDAKRPPPITSAVDDSVGAAGAAGATCGQGRATPRCRREDVRTKVGSISVRD